jgi:hypothetical protein
MPGGIWRSVDPRRLNRPSRPYVLPKINSNGRRVRCALVCGRLAEFVIRNLLDKLLSHLGCSSLKPIGNRDADELSRAVAVPAWWGRE